MPKKVLQPIRKPTKKPEETLGIKSIIDKAYRDGAERYLVQWQNDEDSWELVSSIAHFEIAKNFERAREEAPARDETVHFQPGNVDEDVEMEGFASVPNNGSKSAGGDEGSSPITHAGEEDGRLRTVEAIYLDQHLMDCAIRVTRDGTKLRAHKLLLAYGSERFFKEIVEKQANDVTIDDCSSQAVRTLLDIIYGKDPDVAVIDECAAELLPLADEHKVMALKALAVSRLLLQVESGNVLKLARLAYAHNVPELMQRCALVLDANRHTIFKTAAWRELMTESTEMAVDLLKLC